MAITELQLMFTTLDNFLLSNCCSIVFCKLPTNVKQLYTDVYTTL